MNLLWHAYQLARALPPEPPRAFALRTAGDAAEHGDGAMGGAAGGAGRVSGGAGYLLGGAVRGDRGVSDRRLPWARCETDAERLDPYNGLLLAAHLDAAFDAGMISFGDGGKILLADSFAGRDREAVGIGAEMRVGRLAAGHMGYLGWHRENVFPGGR